METSLTPSDDRPDGDGDHRLGGEEARQLNSEETFISVSGGSQIPAR
jgi:hypothetical protein